MTTPTTPPAVSEAMREAVAQWLKLHFGLVPNAAKRFAGYFCADNGPIASEIARLTGEREESDGTLRYCEKLWSEERGVMLDRIQAAEADLTRMRAETKRLRAVLQDCRNTIASPNEGICCTIWFDGFTTLQDHIDLALAVNQKPAEVPLLAALSNPEQTDA